MKLLALLIAFGLFHWMGKPLFLQSFDWWIKSVDAVRHKQWIKPLWLVDFIMLVIVVAIVFLLGRVLLLQHDHQLWYLIFNCAILYYCLGPEQLEVSAGLIDASAAEKSDDSSQWIINKLTDEAIHRWFAVIFWFVLLGAAGAIMYRLLDQTIRHSKGTAVSTLHRIYSLLSYPVIWLMVLSLLVASDFDRIWRHCKRYIKNKNWYQRQLPLLYEAMDFAVENCEIEDYKSDDFLTVRHTTLSVLKRMLMVWLVLVAFIVLLTIG